MAGGKSWIRQALATVFSQWHFHLDLLDLWRNELASTSLALFVMGVPDDLATYQKMLAYYEQLITLFAFDTGYDPLVCIYDGEIRSTPWLYEFFSASPIYRDVSDRYYNSKLKDVNTQFTEQFLSNLALFWTVIIPDIFAHMGASAPQAIFESKANKLLSLKKTALANAGDFIKWMSHNYSRALKNYSPFVASPELWRAYNPFIDLYWWTLYGHIMCLRAFQSILSSRRIKPFIEGQKTIISINEQPYQEVRLTGDGIINICIPKTALTAAENKICFNSYSVISCLSRENYVCKGFYQTIRCRVSEYLDFAKFDIDADPFTGMELHAQRTQSGPTFIYGFHFLFSEARKHVITYEVNYTPADNGIAYLYGYRLSQCLYTFNIDGLRIFAPQIRTIHIPALKYFGVGLTINPDFTGPGPSAYSIKILSIEPDDDYPGPYKTQWTSSANVNPCDNLFPDL